MDWTLYQQDGVQKNIILDFGDYVFTKDDVSENLTHSQITNPTGDFVIGLASKAQLTFEINNLYQLIPDEAITDNEFTYKAGVLTATTSKKDLYKKIRKGIVCLSESAAYVGNLKSPYLTKWSLEGVKLDAPEQPTQPVKSLFIVGDKLYCGHDAEPYLTAYSISGDALTPLAISPLNLFQANKIQNYNKRAASFNMDGNILKEYVKTEITQLIDDVPQTSLVDFAENISEFLEIGVFIAKLPERKNDIKISVTAYDFMSKFDAVIDMWNSSVVYPITANAMLQSLCNYVGVTLATPVFLNSDFVIQKNYKGENVTGIQIVQWIAQLAACFAAMDELGALHIRWYEDRGYMIDESSYTDVMIAAFETALVDKLQIKVTDNDLGVIVPQDDVSKTNALIIQNNALLYAATDAELRPMATKIFDAVTRFSYQPFSIKTIWGDPRRRAGDIVTIKTLKGQTIKSPIMSCKATGINALKGEYNAYGNKLRDTKVDAVNQQIQQIRGKTNELSVTVEGTINRLYDAETGDITLLKLTAKGLDLAVNNNRLTFDEKGLSIYNGGLHIYGSDSQELLSIDSNNKMHILAAQAQIDTLKSTTITTNTLNATSINTGSMTADGITVNGRGEFDRLYVSGSISGNFSISVDDISGMTLDETRYVADVSWDDRRQDVVVEFGFLEHYR